MFYKDAKKLNLVDVVVIDSRIEEVVQVIQELDCLPCNRLLVPRGTVCSRRNSQNHIIGRRICGTKKGRIKEQNNNLISYMSGLFITRGKSLNNQIGMPTPPPSPPFCTCSAHSRELSKPTNISEKQGGTFVHP